MQFVIYNGLNPTAIFRNNRLSKVYELKKDIPYPVENDNDFKELIMIKEVVKGGCCGNSTTIRPIISDLEYTLVKRLNLENFRQTWEAYYANI